MKLFHTLFIALTALCFCSCGDDDANDPVPVDPPAPGTGLTFSLSKAVIQANGEDATDFIVKYDGLPVSEGVTIYDEKDNPLTNNKTFTTKKSGEYKFWAAYKTSHSKTITVKAIDIPVPVLPTDPTPEKTDFSKKVLLTKFTGTTCAYCPKMTVLLRKTLEDQATAEKVLIAEAHTFNRSDPGYFSPTLAQAFGISNYPTMLMSFDKTFSYDLTPEIFRNLIAEDYNKPADAGVTGKAELVTNADGKKQIALHVAVKAATEGNYRVGAWLLEDGIKGKQSGAEGYEGDFNTHNNVVRVADSRQGSMSYSGIKLGEIDKAETAEHVFIMDLKDKWVLDNCHIIIFVTKEEGKSLPVVNAVSCPIEGVLPYNYAN